MVGSSAQSAFPPIPRQLIEHLNKGDCILFVGDIIEEENGSYRGRLVSVLVDLLADAGKISQVCPMYNCQNNGKCTQPNGCIISLAKAAQAYENLTNRHALIEIVRRVISDSNRPGHIDYALASLPVPVIITTAYDTRLEAALRQLKKAYNYVVRDTDVPFYDPNCVQVIHLHGIVSQPESLKLTEDDEGDLFTSLSPITKIILQAYFATKTLLFVGFDLNDPYFRALYRQVTAPIERYQRLAYAVQQSANELAANYWCGKITLIKAEPLPYLIQVVNSIQAQKLEVKQATLPSEPYKFLDYFTREDAAIFFGRDLEAALLQSMILAHKLTVFYGHSGVGKTSLLLARVGPALEEAGYHFVYTRMLGNPASEIMSAILEVPSDRLPSSTRGRRLVEVLTDEIPPAGRWIVVLDQFEEFFLRQGEPVRRAFAQELAECLWPAMPEAPFDLRFVLSLRDDFLGHLDELSKELPWDILTHRYKLENLTKEKALLAIFKPAEAFGLSVEERLRTQLITDLEEQGLEATNLQIVLYRLYYDAMEQGLWSKANRQGVGLTLARYEKLGGTQALLVGYLDEVLRELPEVEQKKARAILKSMVTSQKTKTTVSSQEIAYGDLITKIGLAETEVDILLAFLREKRVVRKFGTENLYELAHEVMVEKVWAWFSEKERHLLDVHDMLRQEMSNFQKFRLPMAKDKLIVVDSCRDNLQLNDEEVQFLLYSALAAMHETTYWIERAFKAGLPLIKIIPQNDLNKPEIFKAIHNCFRGDSHLTQDNLEILFRAALAARHKTMHWMVRAFDRVPPSIEILQHEGLIPPEVFKEAHDKYYSKRAVGFTEREFEILFCSSLHAKYEIAYWYKQVVEVGLPLFRLFQDNNLNKPEFISLIRGEIMKSANLTENERRTLLHRLLALGEIGQWQLPSIDAILDTSLNTVDESEIRQKIGKIEDTLANFGVEGRVREVNAGPRVTHFSIEPGPGVQISKIKNLSEDLELALSGVPVRIEGSIPGHAFVRIQVANKHATIVTLRSIMESSVFREVEGTLKVGLGLHDSGKPMVVDLTTMPHLLIAGTTGSGKSVCINAIIATLLCVHSPDSLRLLLVNSKVTEMRNYNKIPHLLSPVITEAKEVVKGLKEIIGEIDRRYEEFSKMMVRDIFAYNQEANRKGGAKLPYILIIIDGLSELVTTYSSKIEQTVGLIAQRARAAGVHLILATPRPSTNIVTGSSKANFPARIAFSVNSQADSRLILDTTGAEKLQGQGDMLYKPPNSVRPFRVQGVYVSDAELDRIVKFWTG